MTRPEPGTMFQCYRTGFSSSSQYIWQFLFFLIINNLLISRHGESGLAVFNVVLNISYLVVGLFDGVGATIQPLAATFHGERNKKAERDTLHLALKWGGALGLVLLAVLAVFAPQVAALFGLSQEMIGMGTLALRCYCAAGVGVGVSILLSAYWQSVGKERQTMVLTFLRSFAVYLLFAVPLAFGPLSFFWVVYPATEYLSLAVVGIWQMSVNWRKPSRSRIWTRRRSFTGCSSRIPGNWPDCWRSARSSAPTRGPACSRPFCHHGGGGDEPGHLYPRPELGAQRNLYPNHSVSVGARGI